MVNSWRKSHVTLTEPSPDFYAVTTLPHAFPTTASLLSHGCIKRKSRLMQARLFVRMNVSSWVSLKIYISNVRPIYVRIELRS